MMTPEATKSEKSVSAKGLEGISGLLTVARNNIDILVQEDVTRIIVGAEAASALGAEMERLRRQNESLREALRTAIEVAGEAREEWDKAPSGMRAGKLLIALSDKSLKYRADITAIHEALEKSDVDQ